MTLHLLQHRLGFSFKDKALLEEALRHPSAGEPSYQRLEFLGDRVLGLAISDWLFEAFPLANEGELTRRLTAMVRESALAKVSTDLGIAEVVQVGVGERTKTSILADVLEAVLGAVWLEGGFAPLHQIVRNEWVQFIDLKDIKDAKTRLQEWLQHRKLPVPVYDVVEEHGPDHDKYFKINVKTEAGDALGEGRSKQLAALQAADNLMKILEK